MPVSNRYAILVLPSVNRVYHAASGKLALAELQCFNAHVLNNKITDIKPTTIAGVSYIEFISPELGSKDIQYLSNLSFVYALFKLNDRTSDNNIPILTPVTITPLDLYDDDLISILKFAGKTNEQFTKLLLNVTLMASSSAGTMQRRLDILDPLCGRGTTLNQALMYGYNAAGIEIDQRDFEAYGQFINRWLKDKRLKHKSSTHELRKDGKLQAQRLQINFANSKEAYKKRNVQELDVVLADTLQAKDFFKRNSFDLIVTDLPYGVKHNNQSAKGQSRSPLALLEQALPVWTTLLRAGGAIGISWNTYLARKPELIALLEASELKVYSLTTENLFRHKVDQAIMRDIIVASK